MNSPSSLLSCVVVAATLWLGAAHPTVQAQPSVRPPSMTEVLHYDLDEYWSENDLAIADFDRDGLRDIVVLATALRGPGGAPYTYKCKAILLRNEGDGTFTDSIIADFPGSSYGYSAGASDLNNDGAPDLVLRESLASHVLLNDGTGLGFSEVTTFQPGYYGLAFVDANNDGFQDLVSGTQTGHGGLIELLLNDGTGRRFTQAWTSPLYGSGSDSIETVLNVDLNGDNWPDIAAREIYSGRLITLLGTDAGDSFVQKTNWNFGARTFALAGGKVNGDSLTDFAAYTGWGRIVVLVNQGGGGLASYWQSPELGQAAFNLAMADFDRDGFDDIFVGTYGDGRMRIYRNNRTGGFDLWWEGRLFGHGFTGTVADMNSDGYPDLIAGEENGIRLWINRTSIPRMTSLSMTPGQPKLTWTALKGTAYRVQYKDRFEDEAWSDLDGDVTANGFTASKGDPTAESSRQRVYRVIEVAP